jgi:hypothetical protein
LNDALLYLKVTKRTGNETDIRFVGCRVEGTPIPGQIFIFKGFFEAIIKQ